LCVNAPWGMWSGAFTESPFAQCQSPGVIWIQALHRLLSASVDLGACVAFVVGLTQAGTRYSVAYAGRQEPSGGKWGRSPHFRLLTGTKVVLVLTNHAPKFPERSFGGVWCLKFVQ